MLDNKKVKEMMHSLGADLCGIANVERFADAPSGYHPLDVMPACRSVISFGCRFTVGTLVCKS
ncbi:MAG: epoxyqueuosine reductase, partial [Lachnospiraceae bacterium]